MSRFGRIFSRVLLAVVLCAAGGLEPCRRTWATEILLKDGRVLRGNLGMIASLADKLQVPNPGEGAPLQLIVFLDDDLRRTFFSKRQIQEVRQANVGQMPEESFSIWQNVLRNGRRVKSVGPVLKIDQFDEFGRRIFTFNTPKGPVDVIQGITELTPTWAKVEGISHIWDMRIATSSLPRDVLHKILMKQIDPKDVEHRKKIARFYLQAERFAEAREALEAIVEAFPDKPELKQELEPSIRSLRQMGAQRLLSELKLRRSAGQHQLAYERLKGFPSEGVAGEILQAVSEMAREYEGTSSRAEEFFRQFDALMAQVDDTALRERIRRVREEIRRELNINTLPRMTAFLHHAGDPDLLPTEKLALAIGGWLIGSDAASENLAVALSLHKVRDLVRQYMNDPVKLGREQTFDHLQGEEGAAASLVAGLLKHMKPPVPPGEPISPEWRGFYKHRVPTLPKEPPVDYLVQLPPEYDPYRRYPTIVTLHGAGTTAMHQVDWWAGAWTDDGWRRGQASRHGYIVIAPQWGVEHQKDYGYMPGEHAAVLHSLRDACRRFAIDTDRVYLSGHSMGGDAAWDLGLAHPDLWAGVIPVVAKADRYVALYWENAELLPFYFVCGELDGTKMVKNSRDLDRYLKRGYNTTVVEYLGRGHEHFYDEVLRVFEWMGRQRRDFYPREYTCATMRQWDNFFWWVELEGLPPGSAVDPAVWPPKRGFQAAHVSAKITENNGIYVRTGTTAVTVWVSPEMLNFEQRATITVNGRRMNGSQPFVQPDLRTLLEDVRTRGDRQHPFWMKFETPTGRVRSTR